MGNVEQLNPRYRLAWSMLQSSLRMVGLLRAHVDEHPGDADRRRALRHAEKALCEDSRQFFMIYDRRRGALRDMWPVRRRLILGRIRAWARLVRMFHLAAWLEWRRDRRLERNCRAVDEFLSSVDWPPLPDPERPA